MKTYILCFVFFALSAAQQDLSEKVFVYPKETATAHTILKPKITEALQQCSVCLRYYTQLTREQTLFSLATPEKFNMFQISVMSRHEFSISINNEEYLFKVNIMSLNWIHVCVTWNSDSGVIQLWVDGKLLPRQWTGKGITIPSTSLIILGQDQDSYGGGFDAVQSLVGELTDVQMWNYELCAGEVYKAMINAKNGTILNWRSLSYENKGEVLVQPKLQCMWWGYTDNPFLPCLIGSNQKSGINHWLPPV